MSEKSNVHVAFSGSSAAEVMNQVRELAALTGGDPLKGIETAALLNELRNRLAPNGQVVKIVPFSDEKNDDATTSDATTPAKRRGRPAKSSEAPAEAGPKAASVIEQAEQTIAENVVDVPATAEVEVVAPAVMIDDVKQALNEFAALHGQVSARTVMKDTGGAPALKDIPAEKYQAVIDGLRDYQPVAQAA